MADISNSDNAVFQSIVGDHGLDLSPSGIDTLQVNITKLCNQSCVHCHVDASPKRTEQMSLKLVDRCLEILSRNDPINTLDITGGAPELNPNFDYFVAEARKLRKRVIVRHNLTVTLDGNPVTGEDKTYLPEFFAANQVEVTCSLPFYKKYFTDKQRGDGVFDKSIKSARMLNNIGYGIKDTGLVLNFIYNPVGAYLPPPQSNLEIDYKEELREKYDVHFNNLYTITNMPINRFRKQLLRLGAYEAYMKKLADNFNTIAAEGVMCRSMISVGYDGTLYDCDFNQMLELPVNSSDCKPNILEFDINAILKRKIRFGDHCLGCTAGNGSSCGGSITE